MPEQAFNPGYTLTAEQLAAIKVMKAYSTSPESERAYRQGMDKAVYGYAMGPLGRIAVETVVESSYEERRGAEQRVGELAAAREEEAAKWKKDAASRKAQKEKQSKLGEAAPPPRPLRGEVSSAGDISKQQAEGRAAEAAAQPRSQREGAKSGDTSAQRGLGRDAIAQKERVKAGDISGQLNLGAEGLEQAPAVAAPADKEGTAPPPAGQPVPAKPASPAQPAPAPVQQVPSELGESKAAVTRDMMAGKDRPETPKPAPLPMVQGKDRPPAAEPAPLPMVQGKDQPPAAGPVTYDMMSGKKIPASVAKGLVAPVPAATPAAAQPAAPVAIVDQRATAEAKQYESSAIEQQTALNEARIAFGLAPMPIEPVAAPIAAQETREAAEAGVIVPSTPSPASGITASTQLDPGMQVAAQTVVTPPGVSRETVKPEQRAAAKPKIPGSRSTRITSKTGPGITGAGIGVRMDPGLAAAVGRGAAGFGSRPVGFQRAGVIPVSPMAAEEGATGARPTTFMEAGLDEGPMAPGMGPGVAMGRMPSMRRAGGTGMPATMGGGGGDPARQINLNRTERHPIISGLGGTIDLHLDGLPIGKLNLDLRSD